MNTIKGQQITKYADDLVVITNQRAIMENIKEIVTERRKIGLKINTEQKLCFTRKISARKINIVDSEFEEIVSQIKPQNNCMAKKKKTKKKKEKEKGMFQVSWTYYDKEWNG